MQAEVLVCQISQLGDWVIAHVSSYSCLETTKCPESKLGVQVQFSTINMPYFCVDFLLIYC